MSQGYLSLVGRSAASQQVQNFFREHNVSWNSVNVYKAGGVTEASLELYNSALEVEFIKKLSPKSSVTHQPQDFIISSITLVNHTEQSNHNIGPVIEPLQLTSRLPEILQTLGEHYEQNRYQGTYSWRKDGVIIEIDYETAADEINYITLIADSVEIKAIMEVADSLSDGALAEGNNEQSGIETPGMQYQEKPTPSEYDNLPVIERDSGSRFGVIAILAALVVALYFYDELSLFVVQLLEPLI